MENQNISLKEQEFIYLGKNSSMQGEFVFEGPTRINSKITGNIKITEGNQIIFDRHSDINGEVYGHDIEIFGKFEGKIHSKGNVVVYPCASIIGEIKAKNLIIKPGAQVNIKGEAGQSGV